MWLWGTLAWGVVTVAAVALHHRFRRTIDRFEDEVRGFMLRFETELATAHPEVEFLGMLPDRFACLLRIDGQETPVGLHEAYRHAQAFPDAFSRMVARLLHDVREVGLDHVDDIDFASAAPMLLPQVRNRQWLQEQGCFGDSGLAYTALGDDLATVYVLDGGICMVFVCRAHLQRWRKTVAEVHNLAVANLRRLGDAGLEQAAARGENVRLHSGDGFDAARVLLLADAPGLLVAIPDRDTLWVGPEQTQDLAQLMATTEAIAETAAHPVSSAVYRLKDGRLEPVPGQG